MKWELKKSNAVIARSASVSSANVHDYLQRAKITQLTWSSANTLDDDELDRLLFPPRENTGVVERGEIDWGTINSVFFAVHNHTAV